MTTTPTTTTRADGSIVIAPLADGRVPVILRDDRTITFVAPDGARMDGAEPDAYRRDVDTHRPRRHKPGCPAARRDRATAAAPRASAPNSAPTHRTATAPASPVATVEPCPRLDVATDLTSAERHQVRMISASAPREDRDDAVSAAIAIVRARRAAPPRRATMTPDERIDADQIGGATGAAAKARRAMIERTIASSRPRGLA